MHYFLKKRRERVNNHVRHISSCRHRLPLAADNVVCRYQKLEQHPMLAHDELIDQALDKARRNPLAKRRLIAQSSLPVPKPLLNEIVRCLGGGAVTRGG